MASVVSKVVDIKSRSENMPAPLVKKHSKVIITLENVLLPEEKINVSPSLQDCLDPETELDLRILGCELIQTSGILLKLPQVAMATGQVLFQRFYYAKSLVRYPMETTAMACIALASKIEESPMKIRDVINVFKHINQVKNGKAIQPVLLDGNYISLKNQVVKAERRLLKELGFCCHVKHPHKIIIMYLRLLEAEQKKLAQSSWSQFQLTYLMKLITPKESNKVSKKGETSEGKLFSLKFTYLFYRLRCTSIAIFIFADVVK